MLYSYGHYIKFMGGFSGKKSFDPVLQSFPENQLYISDLPYWIFMPTSYNITKQNRGCLRESR